MLFSPRISLKELAGLCHRLAISLEAGIDMRALWRREVANARRAALRLRFAAIARDVAGGCSLADAIQACGDFFPTLFCELVNVGEQSGHLSDVFAQLHHYYQDKIKRRRAFLAAIAWPMLQLTAAVFIVGFLIWILGAISRMTGAPVDILGFGLIGTPGLIVYVAFISGLLVAASILVTAVSRGLLWTRPLERLVLRIPVLGGPLETLALARLAWSLQLTMGTGMDVRRAVRLSLLAARNARYDDLVKPIDRQLASRSSLHETFALTGDFPDEFLNAVDTGEQSGKLVEAMGHLAAQYRERAKAALATLTMLAGFAVWCVVALILVALIFRIAMFYVNTLSNAGNF